MKCAIFDLDGTLMDSMWYWTEACPEYVRSLGIEPEENLSRKFLSLSLPESADYLIKNYGINLSNDEICKGIDKIMERHYVNDINMKPFMKEIVIGLYKRGVKLAIATATDRPLVYKCLERNGIREYFDYVITSTEVGKSKQHPDIYMKCSDYFGIPYEDSYVFEDLPYGIESSSKVGFNTVGLYDKPSEFHQERIKASAKYYFKDFDESFKNKVIEVVTELKK